MILNTDENENEISLEKKKSKKKIKKKSLEKNNNNYIKEELIAKTSIEKEFKNSTTIDTSNNYDSNKDLRKKKNSIDLELSKNSDNYGSNLNKLNISNLNTSNNNNYNIIIEKNKHENSIKLNSSNFNLKNKSSNNKELFNVSPFKNLVISDNNIKNDKNNSYQNEDNYPISFDEVLENVQKKNLDKKNKKMKCKDIDNLLNKVNANLINSKIYNQNNNMAEETKNNDNQRKFLFNNDSEIYMENISNPQNYYSNRHEKEINLTSRKKIIKTKFLIKNETNLDYEVDINIKEKNRNKNDGMQRDINNNGLPNNECKNF